MAANMHFVELSRNMMALIEANKEEWKPEKDGLRLCSNPVKLEELAKKIRAKMIAANVEGDLDQLTDSCILNYTHQLCKKKHGDNDARAFRSFVKAGMPKGAPIPPGEREGDAPDADGQHPSEAEGEEPQESQADGQEQSSEGEQSSEDTEDQGDGEESGNGESEQSEGDESEEQESKPEEQAGDGEGNQADTDAEDQSSDEEPAPEQEQEPEEQPQEEGEETESDQGDQEETENEDNPQDSDEGEEEKRPEGEGEGNKEGDQEESEEPPEPEENPQEKENNPPEPPQEEEEKPFLKPRNWEYCVSLYKMGKRFILKGDKGNGKTETILHIHKEENKLRKKQGKPEKGLYIVAAPDDESAFVGYYDAMGRFMRPAFIDAVVNGYDIVFDEVEKGEPRAYATLFPLLANGILTLKDGTTIRVHPETRFMASANTAGRGSEKGYISNKMDPAFLDRFLAVESFYEHEIDIKCAKGDKALVTFVEQWRDGCRVTGAYDQLISYRGVSDIKELSTCGMPGCDLEQAMRSCVTRASALDKDDLASIMEHVTCDNAYSQMLNKIYESMPNGE